MNVSLDPRQLGVGLVAGLLVSPVLQSVLAQAQVSPNWLAALVVGALGLGASAVAGNGRNKPERCVGPDAKPEGQPALTALEFVRSVGASGPDDFAIDAIVETSLTKQVQKPISRPLYDALWMALHVAELGDRTPLNQLCKSCDRLNDLTDAFAVELVLRSFVEDHPDPFAEEERLKAERAHAFPITRLMARFASSGVATSELRWLKSVDRGVFYAFNNIGRSTFHIEGAGPIAHFLAERELGAAIATPSVQRAIDATVAALSRTTAERVRLAPLKSTVEPPPSAETPSPSLRP